MSMRIKMLFEIKDQNILHVWNVCMYNFPKKGAANSLVPNEPAVIQLRIKLLFNN